MKTEQGYNGWANYPTWNVALWLDNDEGLYYASREVTATGEVHEAANALKDFTEQMTPDLGASFAADILGWALGQVDWREIVEAHRAE